MSFALSVTPASVAGSFNFFAIDVPGAFITAPVGVNKAGQIVGWYAESSDLWPEHGFLRAQGPPIPIDYPGAYSTAVNRINDLGQIVGGYAIKFGTIHPSYNVHGFLRAQGPPIPIDYPGARYGTSALGINNLGQIVGWYGDTKDHGFWRGRDHKGHVYYVPIDYPGADATWARGINDLGQIVGSYGDTNGYGSFLLDSGSYSAIDYIDTNGTKAIWTTATGINNIGQIVGAYQDANGLHGFLFAAGTFTKIDYPDAKWTWASGISNPTPKGRYSIVGRYLGQDNDWHGFVATPCLRYCL